MAYRTYLVSLALGEAAMSPADFTRIVCGDVVTKQAFKDECDINRIVQNYDVDGVLMQHVNPRHGVFMDVSEVSDYRGAIEQVRAADEFFMTLPAKVRDAFENDVAAFLDAVTDPSQRERLEGLGVLPKAAPEAAEPPPAAPAAPPA